LQFDTTRLTPNLTLSSPSILNVTPSAAMQNAKASLQVNGKNLASGQLGIALALPSGKVFPSGAQQIATVSFTIKPVADLTIAHINFCAQPITPEVVDVKANVLPIGWQSGMVTIPYGYEADVTLFPRGKNNGTVTVADWQEIGNFVAGLASFTDNNGVFQAGEFQRADCAPRSTHGDGSITLADWVQAGRYAAGLDPVVSAGGPSAPATGIATLRADTHRVHPLPSVLSLQPVILPTGTSGTVDVILTARGNETALGFTLNFDPELLRFRGARLGNGVAAGVLHINTNQAGQGRVGFAFSLPLPKTIMAGKQIILTLTFTSMSPRARNALLSFGDQVVSREVVSASADVLPANYTNGTVSVVLTRPNQNQ